VPDSHIDLLEEFVVGARVVAPDRAVVEMNAQISVVVLRPERHSPAVILQMELGVVLVVSFCGINMAAGADGDELAVECFELHDIVMQVLDREVAIVAHAAVGLELVALRVKILSVVHSQETTYAGGVSSVARRRRVNRTRRRGRVHPAAAAGAAGAAGAAIVCHRVGGGGIARWTKTGAISGWRLTE